MPIAPEEESGRKNPAATETGRGGIFALPGPRGEHQTVSRIAVLSASFLLSFLGSSF